MTEIGIPVPVRGEVVEWTGTELLLFGGDYAPGQEANYGATFRPETGEWVTWPGAPFDPPIAGSGGVWTGSELVVAGPRCDNRATENDDSSRCFPNTLAAAAFNPTTQQWRTLPDPPDPEGLFREGGEGGFGDGVGWVGDRAVFSYGRAVVAFLPERDEWVVLPRTTGQICAAGNTLVTAIFDDSGDDLRSPIMISLLDPRADEWSAVPPPDIDDPFMWHAYCADRQVFVVDQALENVWRLDVATESWTSLGAAPRDLVTQPLPPNNQAPPGAQLAVMFSSRAWTGTGLTFWNAEFQVSSLGADGRPGVFPGFAVNFEPATGEWSQVVAGPSFDPSSKSVAWVDGYAFTTGSLGQTPSLVIYRPR